MSGIYESTELIIGIMLIILIFLLVRFSLKKIWSKYMNLFVLTLLFTVIHIVDTLVEITTGIPQKIFTMSTYLIGASCVLFLYYYLLVDYGALKKLGRLFTIRYMLLIVTFCFFLLFLPAYLYTGSETNAAHIFLVIPIIYAVSFAYRFTIIIKSREPIVSYPYWKRREYLIACSLLLVIVIGIFGMLRVPQYLQSIAFFATYLCILWIETDRYHYLLEMKNVLYGKDEKLNFTKKEREILDLVIKYKNTDRVLNEYSSSEEAARKKIYLIKNKLGIPKGKSLEGFVSFLKL